MVRLNASAFRNIRINRSLGKESDAIKFLGFFGKDIDEGFADDFAFLFRIADAFQLVEKAVDSVHINQFRIHLVTEHFNDLFRFSLA